jgi:MATE family multidrug resistance protein
MSVMGWMLGMQNTVRPMIISVSVNVINIALSLAFVFLVDMGFNGVALGTMLSNWCGVAISLWFITRYYDGRLPSIKRDDLLKVSGMGRFFKVNTDIMLRSACVMSVSLSVTAIGAQLGAMTLAANAIMMQFFILFSYFMDGFAFAAEALSGRFAGAKDLPMLRKSVGYLAVWALGVALMFTVVYVFGYQYIVRFITSEQDVVAVVVDHSLWLQLIPIVTVAAFIFDGVYIGLTATRRMLWVTLSSALLFFAICFLHIGGDNLFALPDNDTLWVGFLAYLLLRGLLLGIGTPKLLQSIVKSS